MPRWTWAFALLAACSPEYKVDGGLATQQPLGSETDLTTSELDDDPVDSGWTTRDDTPPTFDTAPPAGDTATSPLDDSGTGPRGDTGSGPDDDTGDEPGRGGDEPPTFGTEDCPDGVLVEWTANGLVATSWDPPVFGEIEVPYEGDFDVYHLVAAESGAGQTNESFLLRISSLANLTGQPTVPNCASGDHIVVDADNVAPPVAGTTQFAGTFHLGAGSNLVELRHYCDLQRAGLCPQHHDAGTPCDSSSVNSVHLVGDLVCLVPVL